MPPNVIEDVEFLDGEGTIHYFHAATSLSLFFASCILLYKATETNYYQAQW
jgi:hypothetical protein